MKTMNKILVFVLLAGVFAFTSCTRDYSKPNLQYMPDMYQSIPYEPYGVNTVNKDSMAAMLPPEGSIAIGHLPYPYPNTMEGYEMAKDSLKSPYPATAENLANGKKMYNIYCSVCHGDTGDGQGNLVKRGKFFGVPNYKDREITEGSIYHVIYYGRNMMGSHATQLTEKERWQVAQYVMQLRKKL
jgi:mono/diheme cytochrome c family protein